MDMERAIKTITVAEKWKAAILKKGLRRAKAKCCYCSGYWHRTINGSKNHIALYCDGDCGTMLMQ